MAKYTLEEKYKLCLAALELYKDVNVTFAQACKAVGVSPHNVKNWIEKESFIRLKHKYLAISDLRVKMRAESYLELAKKILDKTIETQEVETTVTVAKINSEGKPVPQYLKKTKRQVPVNPGVALRLLEMYDKKRPRDWKKEEEIIENIIEDIKIAKAKEAGVPLKDADKVNYIRLDDDTIIEI
jgi:hypothetical protein